MFLADARIVVPDERRPPDWDITTMGEGASRALKATCNLTVVGWSACDSDLNEGVAEAVSAYVRGALLAGLDDAEIRADILGRWAARFSEASVDVERGVRTFRADVLAFAVKADAVRGGPVHADADRLLS